MKESSPYGFISSAASTLKTAEDFARIALNNRRPELAKEMVVRLSTDIYFRVWELSQDVRYHVNGVMVPAMIAGEKRSIGEDGAIILSDKEIHLDNVENIPESGSLLVTPNHYSGGPVHGYGTHFGTATGVLRRRGKDIRYILQDSLVNSFTGGRVPMTKWLYQIMTDTYGMLRVPPPSLKVANGEGTTMGSLRAIRTSFKNGEAVGLYPELTGTRTVQEGHYLAGIVARSFLTTTGGEGLILPVGVYQKGKALFFNFGEAYPVSELGSFFRRVNDEEAKIGQQAVANYMMAKVNQLVPYEMQNPKLN